jgi:hypothetical protein
MCALYVEVTDMMTCLGYGAGAEVQGAIRATAGAGPQHVDLVSFGKRQHPMATFGCCIGGCPAVVFIVCSRQTLTGWPFHQQL